MPLPNDIDWDVRPSVGSDTNGGGFVRNGTGTNWSMQTSPQYSVTDAVANGTTTITSATASFGTDVVDNIIYIQGGSGSIAATRRRVVSRTNSTTIVVNDTVATSTGMTLKLGGSLATIAHAESLVLSGHIVHIKASGTTTLTSSIALSASGTDVAGPILWWGYDSTQRDNTGSRPVITSSTSSLTLVDGAASIVGRVFQNIKFTHTGATRGVVLKANSFPNTGISAINCESDGVLTFFKIDNVGAEYGGSMFLENCRIMNSTSSGIAGTSFIARNCVIAGGAGAGIKLGHGNLGLAIVIDNCIIRNNSGDGIDGAYTAPGAIQVSNCVFWNNGGTAIDLDCSNLYLPSFVVISGNIIGLSGAYGMRLYSKIVANANLFTNAYYSNTSGNQASGTPAGSGDVSLSGDPFTNTSTEDYTLDTTSGEGAALKDICYPLFMPFGITAPKRNIGLAQNAYASGGGGGGARVYGN